MNMEQQQRPLRIEAAVRLKRNEVDQAFTELWAEASPSEDVFHILNRLVERLTDNALAKFGRELGAFSDPNADEGHENRMQIRKGVRDILGLWVLDAHYKRRDSENWKIIELRLKP